MHHDLKLLEEFFILKENGSKSFEIRKNDRNYQMGDTVTFHSLVVKNKKLGPFIITGVHSQYPGVFSDFIVFIHSLNVVEQKKTCYAFYARSGNILRQENFAIFWGETGEPDIVIRILKIETPDNYDGEDLDYAVEQVNPGETLLNVFYPGE